LFLGFGEDGGDIVEVALNELDGVGLGGEFLAASGGGITGHGENGIGSGAGEKGADDSTTLLAGGLKGNVSSRYGV